MPRRSIRLLATLVPLLLGGSVSGLADECQSYTLPDLEVITLTNVSRLTLFKTLELAQYNRGSISQCSIGFSADGHLLVGTCGRSPALVFDLQAGTVWDLEPEPQDQLVASAAQSGRGVIAVGGFGESISLWNGVSGELVGTLGASLPPIWELTFSPDGRKLAACSIHGAVLLWDVASQEVDWTYKGVGGFLSVAFDSCGQRLAYGSLRDQVGVLDALTGERILHLPEPDGHVGDVAFGPNELLAAGCDDRKIYIWRLDQDAGPVLLTGHSGYVNGVTFSHDGSLLVSGSHDKTVSVWNVATQERLVTRSGHQSAVLRVAFNPEGRVIASISWDGTVRLWGVPVRGSDDP